jgi:hypothetical protein
MLTLRREVVPRTASIRFEESCHAVPAVTGAARHTMSLLRSRSPLMPLVCQIAQHPSLDALREMD